jgi:nucleotide-binding universal stress UspA family protein
MALNQYVRRVAVAVDGAESAKARLAWAASLADAFDAELTGLAAAETFIPSYSPIGAELLSYQPQLLEAARRQTGARLKAAEAVFSAACPTPNGRFRSSPDAGAVPFLLQEAAGQDLVIAGRHGAGDERDDMMGVDPGEVIPVLGRPLMVVPPAATQFSAARIVIAWKTGRESRRAVADALPYLALADEVYVCAVGNGDGGTPPVLSFLEAHGITARTITEPRYQRSDAEAILEIVGRVKATLLVCGAYGQSRFKEWAFGGVTRDLLDHTPVPCLLSH